MEPLPISVCLIAGNEAGRIRRALDSVAGWVMEIIVVTDNSVTDGTDQIAAACGAKVFREPWTGPGAHRNFASAKATAGWLLALDADEVVSPELREEIGRAIAEPGDCAAFCFPRRTQFCGRWIRHGDWYPDRQTRLWRRGRGAWSCVVVHEKLEVDGRVRRLRSDLLHYNTETLDQQLAKILRFSSGFVQDATANRQSAGWKDVVLRPAWRLVRAYFIRLGFLDGWQGGYIAWMTAFYTATRYAKVRVAQNAPHEKT